MSDRLTRKEIKRDEVMEGLSRAVRFVRDNLQALIGGLAVVLALLAGYAVWQAVSAARAGAANEELAAALGKVPEGSENLSAAKEDLAQIAQRYGRTKAGSIAHAYLGTMAAEAGDFDAARQHWTEFLERGRDHALAITVARNLIALDRAEGKAEELAGRLQAALESGDSPLGEDSVLYELARTLETLDRDEEALEAYTRLLEEHPTSIFVAQARERSSALEAS